MHNNHFLPIPATPLVGCFTIVSNGVSCRLVKNKSRDEFEAWLDQRISAKQARTDAALDGIAAMEELTGSSGVQSLYSPFRNLVEAAERTPTPALASILHIVNDAQQRASLAITVPRASHSSRFFKIYDVGRSLGSFAALYPFSPLATMRLEDIASATSDSDAIPASRELCPFDRHKGIDVIDVLSILSFQWQVTATLREVYESQAVTSASTQDNEEFHMFNMPRPFCADTYRIEVTIFDTYRAQKMMLCLFASPHWFQTAEGAVAASICCVAMQARGHPDHNTSAGRENIYRFILKQCVIPAITFSSLCYMDRQIDEHFASAQYNMKCLRDCWLERCSQDTRYVYMSQTDRTTVDSMFGAACNTKIGTKYRWYQHTRAFPAFRGAKAAIPFSKFKTTLTAFISTPELVRLRGTALFKRDSRIAESLAQDPRELLGSIITKREEEKMMHTVELINAAKTAPAAANNNNRPLML